MAGMIRERNGTANAGEAARSDGQSMLIRSCSRAFAVKKTKKQIPLRLRLKTPRHADF
jgi:hypothetical protein